MTNIEQYINMGLKCGGRRNNSEIPSIDVSKIEVPSKKYLEIDNLLSEFKTNKEKAQARSNLGITPLLEELEQLIYSKDIKFDFEPHANAFDKIISSGALYNILLKYYSKNEVDSIIDELSKVATTGSYNDLIDKPTKLSDFNNDTNYVTLQALQNYLEEILEGLVLDDVVTKDELNNYTTKDELNNYTTKEELGDYITREELFDMQNPLRVTVSVSPGIAEYTGVPQNVRITASVKKGSNNINPDTYQIKYKNNTEDFNGSHTAQISDRGTTVFTVSCTYKSESVSASGSVNFVLPTYFGFDGTEDFNSVDLTQLNKEIKSNIQSTKTLNNNTAGNYLWIVSPYTLNAVATDQGYTYKVAMVLGGSKDGLNYYRSNSAIDISNLTYYIK